MRVARWKEKKSKNNPQLDEAFFSCSSLLTIPNIEYNHHDLVRGIVSGIRLIHRLLLFFWVKTLCLSNGILSVLFRSHILSVDSKKMFVCYLQITVNLFLKQKLFRIFLFFLPKKNIRRRHRFILLTCIYIVLFALNSKYVSEYFRLSL